MDILHVDLFRIALCRTRVTATQLLSNGGYAPIETPTPTSQPWPKGVKSEKVMQMVISQENDRSEGQKWDVANFPSQNPSLS